jgi:hypothetical protein
MAEIVSFRAASDEARHLAIEAEMEAEYQRMRQRDRERAPHIAAALNKIYASGEARLIAGLILGIARRHADPCVVDEVAMHVTQDLRDRAGERLDAADRALRNQKGAA